MNVLVAGGTGFLGSRVVYFLQKKGYSVVTYSKNHRAVPTRADAIVNCIGILREWNVTFEEVHVDLTKWLLGLGKKLDIKQFVQVSAISASSDGTPYQQSKRSGERLVEESGLPYAIIRPSLIYGPTDKSLNMFRSISRTGFCPLFSNAAVQPVHVDTVAKLIVAAVDKKIRNRIVEVGGPEVFTYRELLDRLHRGVTPLYVPKPGKQLLTAFSWVHPAMPTSDMFRMMQQNNTTSDTTVKHLKISNPKVR